MSALQKAIEHFGSQVALAAALGVQPQAITNWKSGGVPLKRCREIERATQGAVTAEDLCPDVFGEPAEHDAAA
jgi:DNA-binding transcriptional regulator YdaS (Cro superfamily)